MALISIPVHAAAAGQAGSLQRTWSRCALSLGAFLFATAVCLPATAAQDEDTTLGAEFIDMPESDEPIVVDESEKPAYVPGYREAPSIGLSPYVPQETTALPGGVTPGFGAPGTGKGYRFNFSGYLQQPFLMTIGRRDEAYEGQRATTLHGDPVLVGNSWGFLDQTATIPNPWTHLAFTYGNNVVQATTILGAWGIGQSMEGSGNFRGPSQLWVNDAFLTYTPDVGPVDLRLRVGAYQDRYGAMAKYTQGAYQLPLMGEIRGMGTTATLGLPFENGVTFTLESGFKGNFARAPVGIIPDNSNEYPIEEQGSTYATHGHLVTSYKIASLGLHYIHSFSQDDRVDNVLPYDEYTTQPYPKDGTIDLYGVDLRIDSHLYGYFYGGVSRLVGQDASSLNWLVRFMHNGGGKDWNERFWGFGSNGNGSLTVAAMQYTLSLGTLLRHPMEFWGEGPDILVSVFGAYAQVGSEAPPYEGNLIYDGREAFKWGTETTYSMLPWLAASLRTDHVMPDLNDQGRSFGVISPKLTFREDWQSRYTLNIQYSGYILGENVRVEGDRRLLSTPYKSDEHLIALFVTMWW